MRTDTSKKIIAYISEKKAATAKELVDYLEISPQAVFKQLKALVSGGQIIKIGQPPKVKYYIKYNIANQSKLEDEAFKWALTGELRREGDRRLCETRDVFQARQEKLLFSLKDLVSENLLYLLVGAVGEIGNNSFDHNLGNWRDTPGVLLAVDLSARVISLADRGQGILATIKRVRPQTPDDKSAILTAFTEIISGRHPEQRGNGLKYVKKIIDENNLYLEFYSGRAVAKISDKNLVIEETDRYVPGTLAIIKF